MHPAPVTTHALKIWPPFFDAIVEGRKTCEVRDARDRRFAVGDYLFLREYVPSDHAGEGAYTGREATVLVTHVTRLVDLLGEAAGDYVVMSVRVVRS